MFLRCFPKASSEQAPVALVVVISHLFLKLKVSKIAETKFLDRYVA